MGWESRGLYCGGGDTWTCSLHGGASTCSKKIYQEIQELSAKLATQAMLKISHKIWCDNSLGVLRPLVPVSMRRLHADQQVHLDELLLRCQHLVLGVSAVCQPQERAAVEAIPVPLHKFSHMHVDLVGPWLQTTEGHTPFANSCGQDYQVGGTIPLQSTTAQVVADSFMANWVARCGPQRTRGPSSLVLRGSAYARPWESGTYR